MLDELAIKYSSDKSSKHHGYCDVYEKYFAPFKNEPITLLELGIGGYHYPDRGGESLKMWYEYFDKAFIVGIDLYEKTSLSTNRTFIHKCSQTDESEIMLAVCGNSLDMPTIIIDDAAHVNPLTIESFEKLFKYVKSGGIYAIEDTHTSYWEALGGDGTDFKGGTHEGTVMNYFKRLCDEVCLGNRPDIEGIHFYKQQIFILKK